jgi:hypothetical protein
LIGAAVAASIWGVVFVVVMSIRMVLSVAALVRVLHQSPFCKGLIGNFLCPCRRRSRRRRGPLRRLARTRGWRPARRDSRSRKLSRA